MVKPGEQITIRKTKAEKKLWKNFEEATKQIETPSWITIDLKDMVAKVVSRPSGEELKQPFDPKLIVEFYSR
jgi:ribosomal protein S4